MDTCVPFGKWRNWASREWKKGWHTWRLNSSNWHNNTCRCYLFGVELMLLENKNGGWCWCWNSISLTLIPGFLPPGLGFQTILENSSKRRRGIRLAYKSEPVYLYTRIWHIMASRRQHSAQQLRQHRNILIPSDLKFQKIKCVSLDNSWIERQGNEKSVLESLF